MFIGVLQFRHKYLFTEKQTYVPCVAVWFNCVCVFKKIKEYFQIYRWMHLLSRIPLTPISRMSAQIQNSPKYSGDHARSSWMGICQVFVWNISRIRWMRDVCFRNSNPYHNNLHAADVLQTTHWFVSQAGLKVMQSLINYWLLSCEIFVTFQSWLSDLEIFSLLLSAIIHDFDHSGSTNNFHIQSGSRLALLYNDKSVLENHHVSSFFQ